MGPKRRCSSRFPKKLSALILLGVAGLLAWLYLHQGDSPIDEDPLHVALDQILRTLEDGRGRHYFIDSETSDQWPRVDSNLRSEHDTAMALLWQNPLLTVTDSGARLRGKTDKVAAAFTRIAERALIQKEWEIAADYVELALRLRLTRRKVVRVTSLGTLSEQLRRLGGMARTAALRSRDEALRLRLFAVLDTVLASYPSPRDAVEKEQVAVHNAADKTRRQRSLEKEYLDTLRDVFFAPPDESGTREQTLARFVPLLENPTLHPTCLRAYRLYWKSRQILQEFVAELAEG